MMPYLYDGEIELFDPSTLGTIRFDLGSDAYREFEQRLSQDLEGLVQRWHDRAGRPTQSPSAQHRDAWGR